MVKMISLTLHTLKNLGDLFHISLTFLFALYVIEQTTGNSCLPAPLLPISILIPYISKH